MSFNSQRETIGGSVKVEFIFPVHEIDSFNGEELKNYIFMVLEMEEILILNLE